MRDNQHHPSHLAWRAMHLATLLVVATTGVARAQYVIGTRDSLTWQVDSLFRSLDHNDSPGCAVGIYREGTILYARGYGMANLELGVPNSPRTVFDIGSISKQFTATAILLLAQDGKLSLGDDIRRYFPEMPPYAAGITIRNLLNHTSGVRDILDLMGLAGRDFEGRADTVDFLRYITRSAETNFPIGTQLLYSNGGYLLLGQLVYRVSQQSLAQFLRARVLDPLGMRDSRSLDNHRTIIPNRAQGYASRSGGCRIVASQFDGSPGGGSMHTTVEDFARWDRNWTEPSVGGRALPESLQVRGRLRNDSPTQYALGVGISSWRGLRVVWHNGAWAGYRSSYLRFPDQHLSVATLCNLTNAGPEFLNLKVATLYLGAKMAPDTVTAWEAALASAKPVSVTTDQLHRYEGAWRNYQKPEEYNEGSSQLRLIRVVGDSLMGGVAVDGPLTRLVPIGAGRFRVGRTTTDLTFDEVSGGVATRLTLRTRLFDFLGIGETVLRRIPLEQLSTAQLAEHAGAYRSEEIETTLTFAADSGHLVSKRGGLRWVTFDPVSRDVFNGDDITIEFVRDPRGRITGMTLDTDRVRNLRFVRQ